MILETSMPQRFAPRLLALLPLLALAACAGQLEDGRFPTGSSPLATASDFAMIYVVDTDGGTVAAIDAANNEVARLDVGLEPTRIARAGDRLFVTLRAERNLAVLDIAEGNLELVSKIPVGAEPFGVVASEDGETVFVASSLAGQVHEIDVEALAITRSWTVRDEPRWLALHPSGKSLYAASARGGVFSRIDLRQEDSVERNFLPELTSVHLETFDEIVIAGRITGDMAVSPNGKALAIPGLYVDNITPVGTPVFVTDEDGEEDDELFEDEVDTGYGSTAISRFNPGLVVVALDTTGDFRVTDPTVLSLSGTGTDFETLRSYPAAVSFSPDGDSMIASLEGAGAVLSIPVDGGTVSSSVPFGGPVEVDGMSSDEGFFGAGPAMDSRSTRTWLTPEGPRGVAFLGDEDAVTYSFLDRKVARITHTSVPANSDHRLSEATLMLEESVGALEASDALEFAPNTLPADVEEGRRLFFATNDSQMAASGAGVSCATCHFDGRNDGLTWVFADADEGADHFRQTPSLAGVVSMTAPVTWTDDVVSVFEEVMITSQGRMGGTGLAEADGLKVASFIDWTREPDLPLHGSTSASVLRGKEIFEREDVGCADCHNGAAFTDNEAYDMYGITGVRTRSLIGIAASAPYLHDGSAPTIDAVLVSARDGEMGDTSGLNSGEMKDLADYVKSL